MRAVFLSLALFSGVSVAQNPADEANEAARGHVAEVLLPEFSKEVHEKYFQSGTGKLIGQGFMKQRGGGVVTCAGNIVVVMPATQFYRDWLVNPRFVYGAKKGEMSELAKQPVRFTICDAQGNFEATKLPEGNWLVMTDVIWQVGDEAQGGGLLKEVVIENGEQLRVLVTDSDFYGK